jgi:DNA (cytosine-5)-methyltransferase 1
MTEFEMLMQQSGWTVPEAAKVLGYSEGHVYRWKRGEEAPRDGVIKLLKMQVETLKPAQSSADFSFIDLFAGIGGLP